MTKAFCCALATLALFFTEPCSIKHEHIMTGRFTRQIALADDGQATDASQAFEYIAHDMLTTTLYFRFGQTQYLGEQQVELDLRRDETVANALVKLLLKGPDAVHASLTSLFSQETRVISVSGDDTTAFVTLSSDFLGRPDGAPVDWENSPAWQEEAALRRRLALASIVLALTQGARYQRVQFYVADSDDDMPRYIELYNLDMTQTDTALVLGACGRDESYLLTPQSAMQLILEAWRQKDWTTLYALLHDDAGMPSQSAFEQEMVKTDVTLLHGEVTGGAVDLSGRMATVVMNAQIRSSQGGDAQIVRESVPLIRVNDNWMLSLDTLRDLMVRD